LSPVSTEKDDQQHPGDEAADVGEVGHAAGALQVAGVHRCGTEEELHHDPKAEEEDRRDLADGDEDEDRNQRGHPLLRIEHDVGAEHAGNRPRGTDRRHARRGIHHRVGQRGDQAAREIEEEVSGVPEAILDVVAEDPEVEHVPAEVQPPAVKKHRHEHGDDVRQQRAGQVPETRRNEGDVEQHRLDLRPEGDLPEKHQHVDDDEDDVDHRRGASRVVVSEREQAAILLRAA